MPPICSLTWNSWDCQARIAIKSFRQVQSAQAEYKKISTNIKAGLCETNRVITQ